MGCFNSPYGDFDVRVPYNAVEYRQYDFNGICRACYHGLHPHDPMVNGNITEDSQDCKILLLNSEGKVVGQCCCKWSETVIL